MTDFDPNSEYKLVKIGIKDFDTKRHIDLSEIYVGFPALTSDNSLILVGDKFDYIKTSPVLNIQDQGNGNYLVETRNSYYSLEKLNETT